MVLIPKGKGTSILEQRPITVLEIIYRIFAKGVVSAWQPTLHRDMLGPNVMGFRAETGTRHLAQLLSDVVCKRPSAARRRRRCGLPP